MMKAIIATITLTIAATTLADAGQYNSQSARQDREYKSLSAATPTCLRDVEYLEYHLQATVKHQW